MQLLIYTPIITPRIAYTMQLIFENLAAISYEITTDIELWQQFESPKISYQTTEIAENLNSTKAVHFLACNLLFEKNITPQKIQLNDQQQITFEHQKQLIFDPFAAIFWCVSRYEEYLPFQPDQYGRFEANQSFLYQNNLLQQAIVHQYVAEIEQRIQTVFSNFTFQKKRSFQVEMTLDIDNAFAYLQKGIKRSVLATAGNLYHRQWQELQQRFLTYSQLKKDKYDNYEWLNYIHQKYNAKPIYFFLLGDYDKFDKNLSHKNAHLQQLIRKTARQYEVGIHPSFASHEKPEKISIEKQRLETITQQKITKSRQHYLRLSMPQTYQRLIAAGITDDYSMGYGSEIGFRAGIAVPFAWYDLTEEKTTALTVHSFAIMDATLHYYLHVAAEQVPNCTQQVIQEVKQYNATLGLLFHNELIADDNWKKVYEYLMGG